MWTQQYQQEETLTDKKSNVLKCRFCGYTTVKWSMRGKKRIPGMPRMLAHVDNAHPEKAKEILQFSGNAENGFHLGESEFDYK